MNTRRRKRLHSLNDGGPNEKYRKLENQINKQTKLIESLCKRVQTLEEQRCDQCIGMVNIKVEREGNDLGSSDWVGSSQRPRETFEGNQAEEPDIVEVTEGLSMMEQEEMIIALKDDEEDEQEGLVEEPTEEVDRDGGEQEVDAPLEVDPCKFMKAHGGDFIKSLKYHSLVPFLKRHLSPDEVSKLKGMDDPSNKVSHLMDFIRRRSYCGSHEAFKTFWNLLAGHYPQLFEKVASRKPKQKEIDHCTKQYAVILRRRIEETKFQPENEVDEGIDFDHNYIQLRLLSGDWGERTSRSHLEMRGYDRVLPATYQAYLRQGKEGKNISPSQLLDDLPQPAADDEDNSEDPKRVIVRGRAGIGKSTLFLWFCKAWAQRKLALGFTFVFLLQMRCLPSEYHKVSLVDLLTSFGLFSTETGCRRFFPRRWLRWNSHKVLIAIDGIDEVKGFASKMKNVRKISNIETKATPLDLCINLIRGDLLPGSPVLSASRPFPGLETCQENSLMYEIQGHTPEGIKQYVRQTFPDNARNIVSVLEKNVILMSVCAITFYCTLVTKLLNENLTLEKKQIWTYTRLTCWIIVKSIERKSAGNALFIGETKSYFPKLAKLAYNGIFEHTKPGEPIKLVFNDQDLSDVSLDKKDIRKAIKGGILQYTEFHRPGEGKDVIVEFIHLSIQELFAAARFAVLMARKVNGKEKMPKKLKEKLQEISAEGSFNMVLVYLHGLVSDQGNKWVKKFLKPVSANVQSDRIFNSIILAQLRKRKDVETKVQLCQMAYESQDPTIAMNTSQVLEKDGGISFHSGTLTAVDMIAILFVLEHSNQKYNISNISLTQANIDAISVEILASFLKKDKTIKYLGLKSNNIGHAGLKAIGDMLATNEVLKEINLDSNNFEDDDLDGIQEGLIRNKTLHTLSLDDNLITDEGAVRSTQWIAGKSSFKLLSLGDNQISQNGIGRVKGILDASRNSQSRAQSKFMNLPTKVRCQGQDDDSEKYLSAKVVQFSDRSITHDLIGMLYGSQRLEKVILQTCQISRVSIEHLMFLSFTCPSLKSISIQSSYVSGNKADEKTIEMFRTLSFRKQKVNISIKGCDNKTLGSTGWETLTKYKTSFGFCALEGVHILDDDIDMFVKFLDAKCKATVELPKLSLNIHSEQDLVKIGRCIGSIKTAEALNLGEDDFHDQPSAQQGLKVSFLQVSKPQLLYKVLTEGLKNNSTVTHLHVGRSAKLEPKNIEGFASVFLKNKSLTHVSFSNLPLDEGTFKRVIGSLKSNSTVRCLTVKGCDLGVETMKTLSGVLRVNKRLQSLDISQNNLGNKGIKMIYKALKNNRTLLKLQIASIGLTVGGMEGLCSALKQNACLQEIDLRGNDIAEGARYLYETVVENNTLKYLHLPEAAGAQNEKRWKIIVQHVQDNRGAKKHNMRTRSRVGKEHKEKEWFLSVESHTKE